MRGMGSWARGALAGAIVAALLDVATPARAETVAVPSSMASLGDSITRGFNACSSFGDCVSRSWSTGASNGVTSHFVRLQAIDRKMKTRSNLARSGAKVGELPAQARAAVDLRVGYATILIGANDACTSSEAGMTSVDDFRTSVEEAFAVLAAAPEPPRVLVATIPDLLRLWEVGRVSPSALTAWSLYGICPSMLASPLSTASTDVERRARVRQRVIDYNDVLMSVCATHAFCRHDGGVTFAYPFVLSDLSAWDYFHPNANGQNALAAETWRVGFTWGKASGGGGGGKPKR